MADPRARASDPAREEGNHKLFPSSDACNKRKGDLVISRRGGWGLALLLALLVMGSATARAGAKKGAVIGETEERDIGAKMAAQIRAEKRIVTDKTIVEYVKPTGQNI